MSSASRKLLLFALVLGLTACTRVILPAAPSVVEDKVVTPPPPVPSTPIAFRVSGTLASVRVRYSNELDGLTQVTTSLPFTVSFSTDKTTMFLSLDATPAVTGVIGTTPFLSVQIFVNNVLFREASSTDLSQTVTASGIWRR